MSAREADWLDMSGSEPLRSKVLPSSHTDHRARRQGIATSMDVHLGPSTRFHRDEKLALKTRNALLPVERTLSSMSGASGTTFNEQEREEGRYEQKS